MGNHELLLPKSDMIDQKMDFINVRMDTFKNKLEALDTKIDTVRIELKSDIKETNIIIENVAIPRIKHIEQCYLTTSELYINETGRINGLLADVQVIKSVV